MKCYVICFAVLALLLGGGLLFGMEKNKTDLIKISIRPVNDVCKLTGKTSVVFHVINKGGDSIVILFNPNIITGVGFAIGDKQRAVLRKMPFYPSVEERKIVIKSGEEYSLEFDLNRFIEFQSIGEFDINYSVDLKYFMSNVTMSAKSQKQFSSSGSFRITFIDSILKDDKK